MIDDHPTGAAGWVATTDTPTLIALVMVSVVGLGALILAIDLIARRLTAGARERARIRAEVWQVHRARAARRRRRVRARTRAVATSFMDTPGARRALLALLAFTGLAATILSAHGIQDALTGAGLITWWVRILGFAAFEGFMLTMFALSWWHRTTSQDGFDIYGLLTWAGSGLLALVGYHGGGDWLYAVFAPLAAVGFHLTAGAERRRRGGAPSWFAKAAAAARSRFEAALVWLGRTPTSADTNKRDRERRLNRVAARAVRAQRAHALTRAHRVWLFDRAVHQAGARGLLDAAGRAHVAELVATRTTALDALTASALAGLGVTWGAHGSAPERAAVEVVAEPVGAAPEPVPEPKPIEAAAAAPAAIEAPTTPRPSQRDAAIAWCVELYAGTGKMPTGPELVGAGFKTHPGNARKWIATARERVGAA